MENTLRSITSQESDFSSWYNDVLKAADLIDYSSVKGSMIIRPYGYAIWEEIVSVLDKEFKRLGHQNLQMPMFIPESLLEVEKNHVKGFAPEAAWVTHGGEEELEERMCVRPTSEVLFCEHFKKIIKSYRDLPLLYNQWCTIVRWEKTTRPFLRSREILWQEGHTMHETKESALEETKRMLKVYENFQKDYLAIPVIVGKKTEKEKFAGAECTYTVEAMMHDGVALQNGTSHYFGQGFSKAFGIEFLNKEQKLENPYQTSWGVTTRMIGAIIMTHGDNYGLVLPPKIAPIKVNMIPIGKDENVYKKINDIKSALEKEGITSTIDSSDKTPGFKFAESEVKGYPIRLELGPRDYEKGLVTLVRRDTLEKISVPFLSIVDRIKELLVSIQNNLYTRALKRRNSMLYNAGSYEEFKNIAKNKPGFIKVNFCGSIECEEKIKEETSLKSRCIIEEEAPDGNCIYCNKKGQYKVYFGKQY